jgi:hypothetical protein
MPEPTCLNTTRQSVPSVPSGPRPPPAPGRVSPRPVSPAPGGARRRRRGAPRRLPPRPRASAAPPRAPRAAPLSPPPCPLPPLSQMRPCARAPPACPPACARACARVCHLWAPPPPPLSTLYPLPLPQPQGTLPRLCGPENPPGPPAKPARGRPPPAAARRGPRGPLCNDWPTASQLQGRDQGAVCIAGEVLGGVGGVGGRGWGGVGLARRRRVPGAAERARGGRAAARPSPHRRPAPVQSTRAVVCYFPHALRREWPGLEERKRPAPRDRDPCSSRRERWAVSVAGAGSRGRRPRGGADRPWTAPAPPPCALRPRRRLQPVAARSPRAPRRVPARAPSPGPW